MVFDLLIVIANFYHLLMIMHALNYTLPTSILLKCYSNTLLSSDKCQLSLFIYLFSFVEFLAWMDCGFVAIILGFIYQFCAWNCIFNQCEFVFPAYPLFLELLTSMIRCYCHNRVHIHYLH